MKWVVLLVLLAGCESERIENEAEACPNAGTMRIVRVFDGKNVSSFTNPDCLRFDLDHIQFFIKGSTKRVWASHYLIWTEPDMRSFSSAATQRR